jgi:hypothetical protein
MPPQYSLAAHQLLEQQKREWKLLRENCAALDSIRTRTIDLGGFSMRLQFNPARLANAAAKVDPQSIAERKCFLCPEQRPPEQREIAFGDDFLILCNPFPIFREHFTIPHRRHIPQRIADHFGDLVDLARAMGDRYTVFYNGPRCGASAPDHLHFQAGDKGFMPIESEYEHLKGAPVGRSKDLAIFAARDTIRPLLAMESSDRQALVAAFETFYGSFSRIAPADDEPMMNVLAGYERGAWRVIILPRAKHRPDFFYAQGDERILLSPGAVDLGGVAILPVGRDFERLTAGHLAQMFEQVMLGRKEFEALVGEVARAL